jgi:very-short-patch-repair endonuclease/DNA-directed RNA polymerase subunit RPC12/RpoP
MIYPPYERSFASNNKSQFWSKIKNGDIQPRQVFKSTDKKYWFDCNDCGHDFDVSLLNVTSGQWCPYCAGRKICENILCQECNDKSFASNNKCQFWSKTKNGHIQPRQVFKSTYKKYWFDCTDCGHDFNKVLYSVTSGQWCPYCAGHKICENIICQECNDKSFASNNKCQFWSKTKNGDIQPRQVFKSTNKKYWFDCTDCGNDFDVALGNVTLSGNWCPHCVNKTERKLFEILKNKFPTLLRQFKTEWCKMKRFLPFDLCIPELKIIIELDGPQHFIQISNWQSPEETLIIDTYKEKCANENNYSIIRLLQTDVLNDTYDWYKELCDTIEEIINDGNVKNVYICKNDEYHNFTQSMAL